MRVSSSILAQSRLPGEPEVVLKAVGIGSVTSYELRDREGRAFILAWSAPYAGHIIRIPLNLWAANKAKLAHDIMQRPGRVPIIVLFEVPAPVPVEEGGNEENKGTSDEGGNPPAATEPLLYGEMMLREAIADTVKDGPQRIKVVAHHLDTDEDTIKQAAAEEGSTVEIATGGWVRLKVTESTN